MKRRPPIAVQTLLAGLDATIPEPKTELRTSSPFELLVAVMLSAQMTDSGVNRVTGPLFARYPTAAALAKARIADVEELIRRVNYYKTKARHLIAASRVLMRDFEGEMPLTITELTTLPGVGRKTANVLVTELAPHPEGIAVDTHVARVARRVGLSRHRTPERIEPDLLRVFPRERWATVHHQLVLHGRYVCKARTPLCETCIFRDICPSSRAESAG